MGLSFTFQLFKFDGVCQTVALTLCPLIGKYDGIEPLCYSRNVEFAGMLIFQPGRNRKRLITHANHQTYTSLRKATFIINIVALIMTSIMIYHVKTKYTAIGTNKQHNVQRSVESDDSQLILCKRPQGDHYVL